MRKKAGVLMEQEIIADMATAIIRPL